MSLRFPLFLTVLSLCLASLVATAQDATQTTAQPTAQDAAKNALAVELLEITESRKLVDQMIPQVKTQMKTMFRQMLGNQQLDEDLLVVFDKYSERMVDLLKQEMRWEKLEPHYVQIYVDVFSEDELRDLIAFYRTPLGQKMLEKMPQIMQASLAISQQQMRDILPQIQSLGVEMASEMQAVKAQRKSE